MDRKKHKEKKKLIQEVQIINLRQYDNVMNDKEYLDTEKLQEAIEDEINLDCKNKK
ncbi:hypothetical protein HYE35_00830 [Mycoplasmopsis bovis]|nr:hypothetical protein [Mycoplasmopsis bovis]QQH21593.1 hypothetical protein HYE35_00830 [Mycoplasmopsis bovis]